MSRLWSPAGGIPEHPPPFGVWVGDPAPAARPPVRPPAPSRPRWRRSPALLVAVGAVVMAMVAGSVVTMVDRLGATTPPRPGPVPAPTLDHLDAAITRGEMRLTPSPLSEAILISSGPSPSWVVNCWRTDSGPPSASPMRSAMKLFE